MNLKLLRLEITHRYPDISNSISRDLAYHIVKLYNNYKWIDESEFIELNMVAISEALSTFDKNKGRLLQHIRRRIRYVLQRYVKQLVKVDDVMMNLEFEDTEDVIDNRLENLSELPDDLLLKLHRTLNDGPSLSDEDVNEIKNILNIEGE